MLANVRPSSQVNCGKVQMGKCFHALSLFRFLFLVVNFQPKHVIFQLLFPFFGDFCIFQADTRQLVAIFTDRHRQTRPHRASRL